MGVVLLIFLSIAAVAALVFLLGRALGDPVRGPRFDEIPADVVMLDTSDGTPVDIGHWDSSLPRQMTPEEQEQATKDFERLRVRIEAERR